MNNEDRKRLEDIKGKLEEAKEELIELCDVLEEKTCNVEEYFEGTEKAETMREQTDSIDALGESLETLISEFDDAGG